MLARDLIVIASSVFSLYSHGTTTTTGWGDWREKDTPPITPPTSLQHNAEYEKEHNKPYGNEDMRYPSDGFPSTPSSSNNFF